MCSYKDQNQIQVALQFFLGRQCLFFNNFVFITLNLKSGSSRFPPEFVLTTLVFWKRSGVRPLSCNPTGCFWRKEPNRRHNTNKLNFIPLHVGGNGEQTLIFAWNPSREGTFGFLTSGPTQQRVYRRVFIIQALQPGRRQVAYDATITLLCFKKYGFLLQMKGRAACICWLFQLTHLLLLSIQKR